MSARYSIAGLQAATVAFSLPVLGVLAALAAATSMPAPLWSLLVFAPVVEEVVFRRGIQEGLLRRLTPRIAGGALIANVVAAFAFAFMHALTQSGVLAWLTLLPSLLMGWVYQARRRLDLCIALHLLFNLIWLLWAGTSI